MARSCRFFIVQIRVLPGVLLRLTVKIGEDLRASYNLATDKEAQKVLFGQRARK